MSRHDRQGAERHEDVRAEIHQRRIEPEHLGGGDREREIDDQRRGGRTRRPVAAAQTGERQGEHAGEDHVQRPEARERIVKHQPVGRGHEQDDDGAQPRAGVTAAHAFVDHPHVGDAVVAVAVIDGDGAAEGPHRQEHHHGRHREQQTVDRTSCARTEPPALALRDRAARLRRHDPDHRRHGSPSGLPVDTAGRWRTAQTSTVFHAGLRASAHRSTAMPDVGPRSLSPLVGDWRDRQLSSLDTLSSACGAI